MIGYVSMLRLPIHRFSLLALLLVLANTVQSQSPESVIIGQEHTIHSRLLGEERRYVVSLPSSYENDEFYVQKRYPVAILLDADTHFRYASGMIQFMSAGETEQIPEMIVVAVRNTNRTRDMTSGLQGNTSNFLRFLESELVPQIEKQYRTLPYRVLIGHSLAGLFALNCFLDQRAFNAYITIDPTLSWNDEQILKKAKTALSTNTSYTSRLYVAQANNPFEAGQHTGARGRAFGALSASLTGNQAKRLTYRYAYYAQETHFSVPFQSLRDGLLFVFDTYQFPFDVLLTQGSAGISSYYNRLSDQFGVKLLPPGKVINQAGLFLLYSQKQVDKALDLLKLNESYYPNSFLTYNSLADAYKAKGDTALAIQNYRKALALKATDAKAAKAIQELANSAIK